MVNSNVYIIGTMTLNITHMRGKGGYNGWMTLKLSRCVRVRYLHMCAKFQVSMVNSCRENPDWGVSILSHLIFLQYFFKVSWNLSSCFSTNMFQNNFLCLQMTGANIAGPVFLPKNTFIEQGCQFHYWSFEFAIFRNHYRSSDSAIASFLYFHYSRHLVVGPFHILIHDPNQIIHFQLSHIIFVPFVTHIPFRQVFFSPSGPDHI